jgi:hypothetical protein
MKKKQRRFRGHALECPNNCFLGEHPRRAPAVQDERFV